ncbi:MAG: SdrD B-like domain-containing protein [Arcicella sp.]|nr:SdrD B-like domain-containing protein [Arcicella sp.]
MKKDYTNQTLIRGFFAVFCLLLISQFTSAQTITGTAYRDFNNNGAKDNSTTFNELGLKGVLVCAYKPDGSLADSIRTANDGTYTLNSGIGNFRVEFKNYPSGFFDAKSGGTSVQFVAGGATGVNVGINAPSDYCQNNPQIALSCFENGSGVGNTNAAFVTFPFNSTGTTPAPSKNFDAQTLGSVYGTTYQNSKKLVYTAAFLKRHSGLGPRGMDGVYVMDYSTSTPTLVGGFDLQGVTPANGGAAIDLGTVTRTNIGAVAISAGAAGDNQLPSDRLLANRDLDAFVKVGTKGYGDIDVSEDGNFLWMVNLNQRTLVRVDISTPVTSASIPNLLASAKVSQYPIFGASGVPTCTNGELRPFGLEFRNGRGYVGCVCDGSASTTIKQPSDLKAYVLSFDPASPTSFTQELSVNLNYNREPAYKSGANNLSAVWQRWTNSNADYTTDRNIFTGLEFVTVPQPILSDIDITDDGSMVLSFQDRFTHQGGNQNYIPTSGSTALIRTIGAGDILYAKKTASGYTVEPSNTDASPVYPGFLTNDGPNSDGEYFYSDYLINAGNTAGEGHYETSIGSSAFIPGTSEVAGIAYDPAGFFTQGVNFFNIATGAKSRDYTVLSSNFGDPTGFGKGSSLGDLEVLCNVPPIEIGNRIWKDTDADGIQDPNETPLVGVTVQLYTAAGVAISGATATTDANGNYIFSSTTIAGLLPNTGYQIRVTDLGSNASVTGLTLASLTPLTPSEATATNTGTTLANNDGKLVSGIPTIILTTGDWGENNHTLDIGFSCKPTITATPKTQTVCFGQTPTAYTVSATNLTISSQQWYGPLADTTSTLGTAISGATATTFTPSGANLPAAGTTRFYAVIGLNGAGCADTAFVSLTINAQTIISNAIATPATCNGGTANSDAKIEFHSYQW